MKRLAIFTEGGTESAFVKKLLLAIAGEKNLRIERRKSVGGSPLNPRRCVRLEIMATSDTQKYYVLIVDCGQDERVNGDIREQYESLCAAGYSEIVGLRDVYPLPHGDIPKLRRAAMYGIRTVPVTPKILFAIKEVEAWFLAEYTHLPKIAATLSLADAAAVLGFDPSTQPELVETVVWPAGSLDMIYQRGGERYEKHRLILRRTVDALDCERMYLELGSRIPSFASLVGVIDGFLS